MKTFLIFSLLLLPTLVFAEETKEFVSLTKIPGLTDITASPNIEIFLNNLYRICIGLAAVIAVLQIIRAGVMYMLGDSFTEKKEAKNLIAMAIFGLVLVLSPVIVFSIINKDILSLKFDVSGLKPKVSEQGSAVIVTTATAKECTDQGGTAEGEPPNVVCTLPPGSKAGESATACTQFQNHKAFSSNSTCAVQAGEDYSKVNNSCCAALKEGEQCCAQKKPSEVETGNVYGWRYQLGATGGSSIGEVEQKGPYSDKAKCSYEYQTWSLAEKNNNKAAFEAGNLACSCEKTIKDQGSCKTYFGL